MFASRRAIDVAGVTPFSVQFHSVHDLFQNFSVSGRLRGFFARYYPRLGRGREEEQPEFDGERSFAYTTWQAVQPLER